MNFGQKLHELWQKSGTLAAKSATLGKLLREFWEILCEFSPQTSTLST